jgi:hypothetical protein
VVVVAVVVTAVVTGEGGGGGGAGSPFLWRVQSKLCKNVLTRLTSASELHVHGQATRTIAWALQTSASVPPNSSCASARAGRAGNVERKHPAWPSQCCSVGGSGPVPETQAATLGKRKCRGRLELSYSVRSGGSTLN